MAFAQFVDKLCINMQYLNLFFPRIPTTFVQNLKKGGYIRQKDIKDIK